MTMTVNQRFRSLRLEFQLPAAFPLFTYDEFLKQERRLRDHAFDPSAARNLLRYLADQRAATGSLPDDRTLVLERTRDEMGDWRLCLLSPWGGRVHAPWTIALAAWLRERGELELQSVWSDDGIVLRLPERERPPAAADLLPDPDAIEELVVRDLMLPGELRHAYAETALARERGRTDLERARGEAAALRSLANTAKLLEENPTLLHLRTLQVAAEAGTTLVISPPGGWPLPPQR